MTIYNLSRVCLRYLSADIGHAPKTPSADRAPFQNGQWSDASIGSAKRLPAPSPCDAAAVIKREPKFGS